MSVPQAIVPDIASAAVSGFCAIWSTLAHLRRHAFDLFVLYRIVPGVAVLTLMAAGVRGAMGSGLR